MKSLVVVKSGVLKQENLSFTRWQHGGLQKQMEKPYFTNYLSTLQHITKSGWTGGINHSL